MSLSVKKSTPVFVVDKAFLAKTIGVAISQGTFPESATLDVTGTGVPKNLHVTYTLDEALQKSAIDMLKHYHPDYSAVVVFDGATGRVLALTDFSAEESKQAEFGNLALRAIFPAASIFKIVTAAAAIDEQKMSPETVIPYNGRNHTLYKKNVIDTKFNRYTNYSTLREAFAKSINVVFGKLGLHYIGPESLIHYAHLFKFNQPIRADFPLESGQTIFAADKDWDVVQAASGFTLNSTLSPIHGALIAGSIANNGGMMEPYLIDRLQDDAGKVVYQGKPVSMGELLKPDSISQLRSLMQETVTNGTSRKSFRQIFGRKMPEEIELGGKTGSLSAKHPAGKVDWFVGYGVWKDHRIGVAAVTLNEKVWRVKSSYVAGSLINDYFKARIQDEREVANSKKSERALSR